MRWIRGGKSYMTKISDLPNFPYKSFEQLQEAEKTGKITIGVDKTVAREWMVKGKNSPFFWKTVGFIMHLIPHMLSLGIIVYSVIARKWLLFLLIIPVEFIAIILIPWIIVIGVALYLILTGQFALMLFTIAIISLAWLNVKILYNLSSNIMRTTALNSEEFFSSLYKSRCLTILFNDTGDVLGAEYPKGES